MKRDFNFIPDDDGIDSEFVPDFNSNDDDDNCPYMDIIMALFLQDKPFGIIWPNDKILEFLKARGYKILERRNRDTGEEYMIAVHPDSSSIPDEGHSNLKEVFNSEMQDIVMKWVLRIAKENDSKS